MSNGFDYNRAAMLLAVLEKRGGLKVSQCDAYLNIIGGLTLEEPAADLAAVVAIASSYLDKPVPDHMAAIGEVGLSGEIRSISHLEQRLTEVHRLGFTQCMIPARRARELGVPCAALAGAVDVSALPRAYELGLTAAFPINPLPLPFEQARVSCRENLSAAVENLIRFYCSVAR